MKIITYDCEVFAYDWLVTLKDKESGIFTCIWNDSEALKACLDEETIYIGFNSKHYDSYIIKAIALGLSNQEVKQVNDYIIGGGQGWQCPLLNGFYFQFNNVDIRDDTQQGLSLKAIEGHLGMSVKESSVPFDIDRPLTAEERAETEFYCKHDVDTTEKLIDIRKDYLKNKINLGRLAGLNEVKAMSMTNAKLTAAMLKAEQKPHDDERKYTYPDNLRKEFIPQEVFDFFNKMYDPSISDDELFKGKINLNIGECPVTIGYGGIHGAIPNFFWEESEDRGIWNEDVGSYYPHLCTINGYSSRNIPSPKIYEDVLDRRMKAKAAGDKQTANALKLVCNTTYGAMLNQFNDLYDPLMGRSVCISGQLYLLELAEHCCQEIEGLRIVQLNTDGIMVECGKSSYPKLAEICREWQERTKFTLEEDTISKISQKDVNNYVEVQKDGSAKAKGGYLVKGIAPAGAFNINNSSVIVATALKEYFVNGTPVEQTINNCNDIFQFQIIAKAGAKYKEAYHIVDGEKQPVQKVNRVYATADTRYGKLYKVKAENNAEAKIEMLPEHCIIDNENKLTIDAIDKGFYIEVAKKRVNDFMGIKPEKKGKKMAVKNENPVLNVYQKLLTARAKFLAAGASKSGKHMELRYKYFELDDIVPTAIGIFAEVGLVPIVSFTDEKAAMTIVNTDNPAETIEFSCPMRYPSENRMVNPVQALGSAQTYLRRYLYMIALDICEPDSIEPTTVREDTATPVPAPKAPPATPAQREEVKKELTAPADNATELQIKGLKAVLKKLRKAQPDKAEMVAEIAVKTQAFTVISKADCEALIERITGMLEEQK
jgi:hypothetical protein